MIAAHDVLKVIQRIAETELELRRTIAQSDRLVADLQMDSLASMILAVGLENHFRVRLNEQDAAALITVADVIALVQKRVADAD